MPRTTRTRPVTAAQARSYLSKAQEYADAASDSLVAGRYVAATSLAIHAGINAGDAVTGTRVGRRAAGQDHDQALHLLGEAGTDGKMLANELARLLPLKTRAEYDPDEIPRSTAEKAVERARRCVAVAGRVLASAS